MARFFLDLHECGEIIGDEDGVEAADLPAARTLAVSAARDVMCGEITRGDLCLACFIEIRDDRQVVDRVLFSDAVSITGL